MQPTTYHPISCDLYDTLTLLAIRGTEATLVYQGVNGRLHEISARILDINTEDDGEYLILENQTIRLDQLVRVNDQPFSGVC